MEVWGGIECSINRIENQYFDQLSYHDQYQRKQDLAKVCDLGITKLRYPILWEKNWPDQQQPITWAVEENLKYLKSRNVSVIAGLIHHGSGPTYVNILDDGFAEQLACYAEKVATKFPWINYYTPINEPLTTARFCGLYGLWYPHCKDSSSFLQILINECKATVLAMQAIQKINPKAKLVLTEDLTKIHSTPKLQDQATFENHRRWLSIDLLCGKVNDQHPLWDYLLSEGVKEEQLFFFIQNNRPPDVLGFNYYITSERFLDENIDLYPMHTHGGNGRQAYADIEAIRTDKTEVEGVKKLLYTAWHRYQIPLAITEAHLYCGREDQLRWLQYIWQSAKSLVNEGVKIEGVTFWSLFGAYGWDRLLTAQKGTYETGAFDLSSGAPRATAITKLINAFAKNETYRHPVAECPGWWDRPIRLFHPTADQLFFEPSKQCQPLLIIGATGTLGQSFMRICNQRGIYYKALTRKELDIKSPEQIEKAINHYKPWAIINAAGFVRVDDAELAQKDCYLSNTIGPINLAISSKKYGIKLLTFSSDLVFDGQKKTGYLEHDAVNPLNIYGLSKARAEQQILQHHPEALIIRTSAFFSPWDRYNFVSAVLSSLKNGAQFKAAADVFISPTYVPDLVKASLDLLIDDECGIWHLSNEGILTWHDFAMEIADRSNANKKLITAVAMEQLELKAKRPMYSALKSAKGMSLPTLESALDHCLRTAVF
jgi:dTDP-4-dehydrorhamnose reductase